MLDIPSLVQLTFDPLKDPHTRPIFEKDIPRKLWLAWSAFGFRRSNHFAEKCLIVGERLEARRPATVQLTAECFQGFPLEFRDLDVAAFVPNFLPILQGTRDIAWQIASPDGSRIIRQ